MSTRPELKLYEKPVEEAEAQADFATKPLTLRQRVSFAALDGLLYAVGSVLRLGGRPLQWSLIYLVAHACYALMGRKRRIAMVNLDLVFGDEKSEREKRRIVRRMFIHFTRLTGDLVFDWVYWPPGTIKRRVRMVNADVLAECAAGGRGWLGVAGHLGNWELLCTGAVAHGLHFTGVFRRAHSPYGDRFIGRKRVRYGMHLIEAPLPVSYVDEHGVKRYRRRSIREQIEAVWDAGHGVGYLCDQYPGKEKTPLTFMGVPDTPTPLGVLSYALDREIPIALGYCVYTKEGADWIIEGPIHPKEQPGGRRATLEHYAQVLNDWLGEKIREHPEQWSWGHRRFRRYYYERERPVRPGPPGPGERES